MLHTEADINYTSLSMLYLYKAQSIMCLWCSVNSTQSITKSNSTTLNSVKTESSRDPEWLDESALFPLCLQTSRTVY